MKTTELPAASLTQKTACKVALCDELASGCEYCEQHHMRRCGQLHHRLTQQPEQDSEVNEDKNLAVELSAAHTPTHWRVDRMTKCIWWIIVNTCRYLSILLADFFGNGSRYR